MKAKKSLGQNFLIDLNAAEQIVAAAKPAERLVEIGPGPGVLTRIIARQEKLEYRGIELDKDLCRDLQTEFSDRDNMRFICEDVLKTDPGSFWPGRRFTVIGNIPYYITTPIIFHLLGYRQLIDYIVLLIQKEVAVRLTAGPGNKDYGVLTIAAGLLAETEILFDIPAESFRPRPKVDSTVVRMRPRPWPGEHAQDPDHMQEVMRRAFQQRRKMLRSSLRQYPLDKTTFDLTRRPETLSIDEWIRMSNELKA